MHPAPQGNDLTSPQHPYHNTWRKWNPKHKSSPDKFRNPRGFPWKPLMEWNGAQTDVIGLSKLTLGRAENAYSPRRPYPERGRGYVGYPYSARYHATTHQTTATHPPGSNWTIRTYGSRTPLPTQDTPRPRIRSPSHAPCDQATRGLEVSQWRNTRADLPDGKGPRTPRLGSWQPSQMYRDRVHHLLLT